MTTNIVQNLPKVGFPVALATKPKKSQKRVPNPVFRKGCLGTERPPALFESDSSFARGFGETNRARRGLGNWDVSRETFVLLLLMFHVKHSALPRTGEEGRGGSPPLAPAEGLAWSAAPPRALSGDALVEHEDREPQVVEDDAHADGSDEGGDYGCRGPELPVPRAPA